MRNAYPCRSGLCSWGRNGLRAGKRVSSHHGSEAEKDRLAELEAMAFYPLAFPMIVGPGTIATTIVFTGQRVISFFGITIAVLYFASYLGRALSETMRTVMTS